jgi:hypothetical protein
MKSLSCEQIDQQGLVELYVAGKLPDPLREQFEQHISNCETHAQALLIEKSIKRGVQAYAREELKKRIHAHVSRVDTTRTLILRFAAIFLIGILTPLLLIYLFNNQHQPELTQNIASDSTYMRSAAVEESIQQESERATMPIIREKRAAKSSRQDTGKAQDLPPGPSLALRQDDGDASYTSGKGLALLSKKETVPKARAMMEMTAAGESIFAIVDTSLQSPQYDKILQNHEKKMQTYFQTMNVPAAYIDFKFIVSPMGYVDNIKILNISAPLPVLEDSLTKSLQKLKFPQTGRSLQIHKKYIFKK